MFDLNSCVAFLTNKASKILSDSLNNELLKHGVTKSQWIAMYYIDHHEGISQKELAELMLTKEPTITGIINRVEKEGYLHRTEDKNDKRRKIISLTAKGKRTVKQLTSIGQEFRDTCLDGVSFEEQEVFVKVLDNMMHAALKWEHDNSK